MNKENNNYRDDRFAIANKEALIGIGLVLFNFIWWISFAYGLGGNDVSTYTYILGLPAWFFYSCVLSVIMMPLLVWIAVKLFFVDVALDDEEFEEE
ncbi:sodium:pantothenate symporter [Paraliobacillus quinghaiensis]|uniref:Sodium:pantothenate symporter n=1 Tax=Paraliobacillus quinghaiensis TaxID=470815 RepID=A0A917WSK6_9BACI|nr:YhdT family protein [Paraliobacillus quinghaiensis]GGM27920.1 sodium:pantothenate symporter [Paraliobacillus quinghaiensis]